MRHRYSYCRECNARIETKRGKLKYFCSQKCHGKRNTRLKQQAGIKDLRYLVTRNINISYKFNIIYRIRQSYTGNINESLDVRY
jgi:hypothetical protein